MVSHSMKRRKVEKFLCVRNCLHGKARRSTHWDLVKPKEPLSILSQSARSFILVLEIWLCLRGIILIVREGKKRKRKKNEEGKGRRSVIGTRSTLFG